MDAPPQVVISTEREQSQSLARPALPMRLDTGRGGAFPPIELPPVVWKHQSCGARLSMAAKTLASIGWHASCVVVGAAPHEVANNARLHLGNCSMSDLTRRYRRKLSVHIATPEDLWKLFLLQGGGLILLGLSAAIIPNLAELPIGALIGWFLLIAGLFRLGSGFGAEIGPG